MIVLNNGRFSSLNSPAKCKKLSIPISIDSKDSQFYILNIVSGIHPLYDLYVNELLCIINVDNSFIFSRLNIVTGLKLSLPISKYSRSVKREKSNVV